MACGQQAPIEAMGGCPVCRSGVLEVAYAAIRDVDASVLSHSDRARQTAGIWRWQGLLPSLNGAREPISLGEGDTPLLRAPELGANVWLKYEGKNPTHSFKDRFQAVAISAAVALGKTRVVCASTGIHGVAAAAYSARAGLRCAVLTHEEAPAAHVEAIRQFGGIPVSVPAGVRSDLLCKLVDSGWYPSSTLWPMPVSNPYGIEGYKTIAFELFEQLGQDALASAHVFVPVGGGDSLYGIYKGLQELVQLGSLARLPRVHACQPTGAAPLVAAQTIGTDEVPHVEVDRSLALSIRGAARRWWPRRSGLGQRDHGRGRAPGRSRPICRSGQRRVGCRGVGCAARSRRDERWTHRVHPDGVRSPLAAAARLASERRAACGIVKRPGVSSAGCT